MKPMTHMEKKHRINLSSFDLVKGAGILEIVTFHTLTHVDLSGSPGLTLLSRLIQYTAIGLMPMFFVISGYGFKEKSPAKMLKKTVVSLIVPYLCVMLGYLVIYPVAYCGVVYHGDWRAAFARTMQYIAAFLLGLSRDGVVVFGYRTTWCTAAWYFLATFVAFNVLNGIVRLRHIAAQAGCVLLCAAASILLFRRGFYFYCLPQGLVAVAYCYVGYLLRRYDLLERLSGSVWTYLVLIPAYLIQLKWGGCDLAQGVFRHIVWDYIGAGCAGLLFLFIGIRLAQTEWKGLDWIRQLGMYSYWIFALHSIEMEALPWSHWLQPLAAWPAAALLLEALAKIVLFTAGCTLLKKAAKYRYQRRLLRHGYGK